jgi:hypothetical protein
MSSEERKKILQMVADGKISADEAATLMRALDESTEEEIVAVGEASGMGGERSDAPEFDQVRRRAHRFSNAFLWIGVIFTVLSAWAMFGIQQNAGTNFWFYCMGMPLFLGILFTTMGAGSKTSRWVYVNVDRTRIKRWGWAAKYHDRASASAWACQLVPENFGGRIDKLKNTNVDEIVQAIAMAKNITEPLIVHVDNDDDGEKVQVFIG